MCNLTYACTTQTMNAVKMGTIFLLRCLMLEETPPIGGRGERGRGRERERERERERGYVCTMFIQGEPSTPTWPGQALWRDNSGCSLPQWLSTADCQQPPEEGQLQLKVSCLTLSGEKIEISLDKNFLFLRAEVPSSNSSTERNSTTFYEKESRRVCNADTSSINFATVTLANHLIIV